MIRLIFISSRCDLYVTIGYRASIYVVKVARYIDSHHMIHICQNLIAPSCSASKVTSMYTHRHDICLSTMVDNRRIIISLTYFHSTRDADLAEKQRFFPLTYLYGVGLSRKTAKNESTMKIC